MKRACCLAVWLGLGVLPGTVLTAISGEIPDIRWQDRVIPLPKEMRIDGALHVRAGDIRYRLQVPGPDPVYGTVREVLDGFAKGGSENARLTLTFVLADAFPEALPAELVRRLRALPNAAQAYAVFMREGDPLEIVLAANRPVGLLYAAHTIAQLFKPGPEVDADSLLVVPRVHIVDWPDIEWRGTWNSTGYQSMGWNSQWKFNIQNMKIMTWRGDRPSAFQEIRRMDDIDTDTVRAYVQWAKTLGYTYLPSIMHLGTSATRGLQGVSPAVYTTDNPAPRNPMAHGFCWADGQEIYTVLAEEMEKAARIAMEFPPDGRHIEVQLTEHVGTSCYCPSCKGESGYVLESQGIIRVFDTLRRRYPVRLVILLSQGSRPVNDRILALAEGRPEIGFAYYDGQLTYRMDRAPMIPEPIERVAKEGGFIQVVLTLMPGRWDTNHPATIPSYIRALAQEFADKDMRSATHYDMYGAQYYWPLSMAAWGEYLWNAHGRSVEDFVRAYATITDRTDPDLYVRWVGKADEASMELSVSQYMVNMSNARYGTLPEVLEDEDAQRINTIRIHRALRAASEALELARALDDEELLWESEYTLAALKSLAVRLDLENLVRSDDRREEAIRALEELDVCARVTVATGHAWHERAMERREAMREAPGFLRPPVWLSQMPWAGVPGRWQYRPWHNLLHVSDLERMTASLMGIPDTRAAFAPHDLGIWEQSDFKDRRATLRVELTEYIPIAGGDYLMGFHTLEGDGSGVDMVLSVADPRSDERRTVLSPPTAWDMRGRDHRDSFFDYRLVVPERAPGEQLWLDVTLRSRGAEGSSGYLSIRRVWAWDEIPQAAMDRLMSLSD